MAKLDPDHRQVNARIVYWGPEGSGKSTSVRAVRDRLRPDHRGPLRERPTRLDPSVTYEVLPIELGEIAGVRTRFEVIAVPGAPEHAPTRKQLLDEVDGIVFVVDSQHSRLDDNLASFEELRGSLAAYGRPLEDVPIVLQYNKRDLADSFTLEELHRKLELAGAAAFEAVATEGRGVLHCLTTISKRAIRVLREPGLRPPAPRPEPAAPAPVAEPEPAAGRDVDRAILEEPERPDAADIAAATERAESAFEGSWSEITAQIGEETQPGASAPPADLRITEVGRASLAGERSVRVPVTLRDGSGREMSLALTVRLDPLGPRDEG